MPGLLELQRAFASGLRDPSHDAGAWACGDGIAAAARLRVYRNNGRAVFEQALGATFPVVLERVGADYFRQLAHFYARAHPSRAGDLHEVGRSFAGFLRGHLVASPYEWLAELASLEWAVAEAGVAGDSGVVTAAALARLAPESVAGARLRFVPSLRLVSAFVPILSVWRANQPGAGVAAIDLSAGPEYVLVQRGTDGVQLREVPAPEFAFVEAVARGATLEAALDASTLPVEQLPLVLHALFTDAAVADVIPC